MTGLLHFGFHPSTTGVHFAAIAARDGWRVEANELGRNLHLAGRSDITKYLWVESGVRSYPTGTNLAQFPTCGYLIDVHLNLEASLYRARLFDLVFIAQRDYLDSFRKVNRNSRWLPLAAPSSFLNLTREPQFDVGFVGNVREGSRRERTLGALEANFRLNDWRRSYSIAEMGDVYRRSRVVVNDPARGDLNMRFFEAMASGAAVVTPRIQNGLDSVGQEGKHYFVADFDDPDDVVSVVRAALKSGSAEAAGRAARELVRNSHTYEHRLERIDRELSKTPLSAPVRRNGIGFVRYTYARLGDYEADPALASAAWSGVGRLGVRSTALIVRSWLKRFRRRQLSRRTPMS